MAYSTLSDIRQRIGERELIELTDDDGSGLVDEDVAASAIADADEEIDSYVGSRYAVPITPVPGILRKFSADIAIYNLHSRRDDSIPEIRKARYENAVKFLTAVASGKISLGQYDPGGSPPDSGASCTAPPERVMTHGKLSRF